MAEDAPATEVEANTTAEAASKGVRLHVQNLGEDMTTEALLALFEPHGTVKGGEAKTSDDGKCKGFGFVTMSTEEEATKAIAEVNGTKQGEKTITVFLAPAKGKGKDEAKGKGKGKDTTKGKGKSKSRDPPTMYQDPYAAMYPNPYAMDPMQAYMAQMQSMQQMQLMQQMYMTQAYMQMQTQMTGVAGQADAQPQASNDKGKGKKGKGKGKSKDKGTKVDGTFLGKLKSLNVKGDRGYGFIECAETMASYNRDVFISSEFVPEGAEIGNQLQFNVTLSDKGQPRACNVVKK